MDGAAGLRVAVSLAASPVVYEQAWRFIGIFFTGAFFLLFGDLAGQTRGGSCLIMVPFFFRFPFF